MGKSNTKPKSRTAPQSSESPLHPEFKLGSWVYIIPPRRGRGASNRQAGPYKIVERAGNDFGLEMWTEPRGKRSGVHPKVSSGRQAISQNVCTVTALTTEHVHASRDRSKRLLVTHVYGTGGRDRPVTRDFGIQWAGETADREGANATRPPYLQEASGQVYLSRPSGLVVVTVGSQSISRAKMRISRRSGNPLGGIPGDSRENPIILDDDGFYASAGRSDQRSSPASGDGSEYRCICQICYEIQEMVFFCGHGLSSAKTPRTRFIPTHRQEAGFGLSVAVHSLETEVTITGGASLRETRGSYELHQGFNINSDLDTELEPGPLLTLRLLLSSNRVSANMPTRCRDLKNKRARFKRRKDKLFARGNELHLIHRVENGALEHQQYYFSQDVKQQKGVELCLARLFQYARELHRSCGAKAYVLVKRDDRHLSYGSHGGKHWPPTKATLKNLFPTMERKTPQSFVDKSDGPFRLDHPPNQGQQSQTAIAAESVALLQGLDSECMMGLQAGGDGYGDLALLKEFLG
ncbi:uncharacterized protein GIQ15_04316 [Arthroderma uncinatum]|uniref:uncharacterized protein n=1 Tax=Arthroderma uncinatum TaxID=74035 RepID=UPI00144AD79F|nr:uncharacterized protein GIQ15_04316 [Arthroderma uncinatum]KAF3481557.1 hypothetical protein GIQ15_04316 [Arthroderma uncinatum]